MTMAPKPPAEDLLLVLLRGLRDKISLESFALFLGRGLLFACTLTHVVDAWVIRASPTCSVQHEGRDRCVVIGAGIGGLCVAGRLAKAGFNVTIVEKNSEDGVGGRLNEYRWERSDGGHFRWEIGPSLLLLPRVYEETFKELDGPTEAWSFRKIEPSYLCVFDDNTSVELYTDHVKMKEQLERLEPGSFAKYMKYLESAQANLDFGLPNLIQEQLDLSSLTRFLRNIISWQNFPLRSHYDQLAGIFTTEKLRALASFQDLYVGLTPFEAPSVFSLLQAIEVNEGVYYPEGGFHSLARGLRSAVERLGVEILFDTPVAEVRVKGGAEMDASLVVSNVDVPLHNKYMMPASYATSYDHDERAFSTSVVSILWALDRRLDALRHHNVFINHVRPRESWESVFVNNTFNPAAFNFYVHAPARTDRSACPAENDSIMVLVPSPLLGIHETGEEEVVRRREAKLISTVREAVVRRFERMPGMEGFRDMILHERIIGPTEWRGRYGLSRGNVFGLRHNLAQLSLLRPPFESRQVRNLYHIGASTRPGNGVPLVMCGAKILADWLVRIRRVGTTREESKRRREHPDAGL